MPLSVGSTVLLHNLQSGTTGSTLTNYQSLFGVTIIPQTVVNSAAIYGGITINLASGGTTNQTIVLLLVFLGVVGELLELEFSVNSSPKNVYGKTWLKHC